MFCVFGHVGGRSVVSLKLASESGGSGVCFPAPGWKHVKFVNTCPTTKLANTDPPVLPSPANCQPPPTPYLAKLLGRNPCVAHWGHGGARGWCGEWVSCDFW